MLLERILRGRNHAVKSCASAEEALDILHREFFPLISLDIELPGMSGLEFARELRSRPGGDMHYILVGTGNSRPQDLQAILEAGADDYIAKPYHPGLLNIRLSVAEAAIRGIARRKSLEERLRFLATHDPLTKLTNRTGLGPAIEAVSRQAEAGRPGVLLYLDLDNFKIINDTLGHDVGDDLLVKVAGILRRGSRAGDCLVRFGGDEFILVMEDCSLQDGCRRAEELREALREIVYMARERKLRVGASIGIAAIEAGVSANSVMARADEACYAAKARGRNCIHVHTPETEAIANLITDADWSIRIREAMDDGSLQTWYQPMINLATGEYFAQELLVRYEKHGQTIQPGAFLSSLRRSGQMARLDRFMIARAFKTLASHPHLTVSVNISGSVFSDPDYATFIESMLENSAISASRILFEITEDDLISNLQTASGIIRRLQKLGLRFGLDDFGAGFSSLSYLQRLPIDFIKIDGSFVKGLASSSFQRALVQAVQGIATALGVETIAEFIETPEELSALREIGVNHGQGYLFGKPQRHPASIEAQPYKMS